MSRQRQQSQHELDLESANGSRQHEEIPLQRLNMAQQTVEDEERERIRKIFDRHDTDNDGNLDVEELKRLITQGVCQDIPQSVAREILKMSDADGSGHLNFEEFYQLYLQKPLLFSSLINNYCRFVIPPRATVRGDQIDGAYERQMTFCPPPLTMIVFSLVEIIMFLIDVINFKDDPKQSQHIGESTKGPAATLFIFNPYRRFEAYRFVSYMFVHVGIMHLFMNLVIQIFLGVALELVHHWWRVALVYLAGVAAGSMGTSLSSPRVFLAGASGGVYALITAHIATIIMNFTEMEYGIVQLFVFLIFCFTDLGTSVYRHLNDSNDQIGYIAHLSGAVAGLLVGFGVLRNLKERKWERILWWVAVTVYFALMLAGIMFQIFYPQYFPRSES